MAYRAEIEVGVKGAQRLKELRDRVADLAKSIDTVNKKDLIKKKEIANIRTYNAVLVEAQENLTATRIRLTETGKAVGNYKKAIEEYVTALQSSNAAQAATNRLIAEELELRRKQKLAASGIRETTQYAGPIGPGQASLLEDIGGFRTQLAGQTSPVGERIERIRAYERAAIDAANTVAQLAQAQEQKITQQEIQNNETVFKQKLNQLIELGELELQISKRNNDQALKDFNTRLANRTAGRFRTDGPLESPGFKGMRKNVGKLGESLALGAGFPLLFGGGAGSVLGSTLGSFVGTGFGGQILGGAIGAQLDAAVKKAIDLGNAVRDINLERLQELGISITNNIKNQVDMYKKLNDEVAAQAVLATQVTVQTGVFASAQEEIARAGNTLTGTFQNFTATISNAIALIALPLTNALSGVLAIVSSILRLFNFVVSAAYTAGKNFRDFVIEATLGETALSNINAWMDMFNGKLDDATGKARELVASLRSDVLMQAVDLGLAGRLTPGITAEQQVSNVEARLEADLEKARLSKLKEERNLAAQVANSAKETRDAAFAELNTKYKQTKELLKQNAANQINNIRTREAAKAQRETLKQAKQTEQLRVQVASATKLLDVDKQIAIAKADGLDVKVRELEVDRALVKTENAIAEIRAKNLPEAQEVYEIMLAQLRGERKLLDIDTKRAEERAKINKQFKDVLESFEYQLAYETATTREKREQLELEEAIRKAEGKDLSPQQSAQLQQAFSQFQKQQRPLQEFINKTRFELNDLQALAVRVSNGIGDAIANSMAQGIEGLIEGTQTAKEVFANFLKSVGQVLVQEGTKMIGMYIAIGIAKIFAGMGGGGGAKTDSFSQLNASANQYQSSGLTLADFPKQANGGPASGGQPYVVGERGPELFVPGMNGGVMSNSDLRSAMGAAPGTSGGTVLNMSFETTNIAGVEYVSREQLEAAMAATRRSAARDGAKQGMTMTLDRLQQSPSTRRRTGI